MHPEFLDFAGRLPLEGKRTLSDPDFNILALDLFGLQFKYNSAYRMICQAQHRTPERIEHWTQIPFVPTAAFKELELSCLPPAERTAVFHSSGTTEQIQSRHFHCPDSLRIYEASLRTGFEANVANGQDPFDVLILTPPPHSAPHSSLVHMFETVRRTFNAPKAAFAARVGTEGWEIDFPAAIASMENGSRPKLALGTAFSFVHLLDHLAERQLRFILPPGSRVMETGGYKNRSRTMPKTELHSLMANFLGISRSEIICEYGMSELSSQAYDANPVRTFHFPTWTRVRIVSPENGGEVAEGETGLIRILDLANVFSVAAIQTEDLGVRRGTGFEMIGRVALAEPRGCSLMTA